MERADASEVSSDDTYQGALARRQALLGKTATLHALEAHLQITYTAQGHMPLERAIDKLTARELFRIHVHSDRELNHSLATAEHSLALENGIIVYRLLNGDWMEPRNGHYIPSCFPWARGLEETLQQLLAQRQQEKSGESPIPNLQASTAKEVRTTC